MGGVVTGVSLTKARRLCLGDCKLPDKVLAAATFETHLCTPAHDLADQLRRKKQSFRLSRLSKRQDSEHHADYNVPCISTTEVFALLRGIKLKSRDKYKNPAWKLCGHLQRNSRHKNVRRMSRNSLIL